MLWFYSQPTPDTYQLLPPSAPPPSRLPESVTGALGGSGDAEPCAQIMFLGPGDQFQQLLKGTREGQGVTETWTGGPGAHLLGLFPGEASG